MDSYAEYIYKSIFNRFVMAVGYEIANNANPTKAYQEAIDDEIAEMEKLAAYYQYEFCR